MEGIPQDVMDQHRQRVIREFHESAGNRQASMNQAAENANKKPKIESKEDLKARLAAFKAKKAAGELPGATHSNGSSTPVKTEVKIEEGLAAPHDLSRGVSHSPGVYVCHRKHSLALY